MRAAPYFCCSVQPWEQAMATLLCGEVGGSYCHDGLCPGPICAAQFFTFAASL